MINKYELEDMMKIGNRLKSNYNGQLTIYREDVKTEEGKKLLEHTLKFIENTLHDYGFKYTTSRDRKGKVRRIDTIEYRPEKDTVNRGIRTFSKRKPILENKATPWTPSPEDVNLEKLESDTKAMFIYIKPEDYDRFKDINLMGDSYVNISSSFEHNEHLKNFEEDSFVGIVTKDNSNGFLRVRAKSSFLNYKGWEDYIIKKDEFLVSNMYKDIFSINFEDRTHLGRARYMENIMKFDSNFFDVEMFGNKEKFEKALNSIITANKQ